MTHMTQPPDHDVTIFRQEAVDHHFKKIDNAGLLRIHPIWSKYVIIFAACILLSSLILSIVVNIEISERGRGILRPVSGVRTLIAQYPGVVAEIPIRPGDEVKAGQLIIRLDNPQLSSNKIEAVSQHLLMEQNYPAIFHNQDKLY